MPMPRRSALPSTKEGSSRPLSSCADGFRPSPTTNRRGNASEPSLAGSRWHCARPDGPEGCNPAKRGSRSSIASRGDFWGGYQPMRHLDEPLGTRRSSLPPSPPDLRPQTAPKRPPRHQSECKCHPGNDDMTAHWSAPSRSRQDGDRAPMALRSGKTAWGVSAAASIPS